MKKTILAIALFASAFAAFAAETAPLLDKGSCEKMEYPRSSLMNEESGTVSFSVLVNADGSVAETKLDSSSGSKNLDKAALKGYSNCKFKPGSKDGKPAQAWAKMQHVWSLG